MSDYELIEHGNGRVSLSGRMTFANAGAILRQSEPLFEKHTRIEVDLSGVTHSDSAGLALLLEWITWANHTVREIRFTGIPEKVRQIARTTEVDDLLRKGERWAGFIQAPGSRATADESRTG